jgi:hypothetical protein
MPTLTVDAAKHPIGMGSRDRVNATRLDLLAA